MNRLALASLTVASALCASSAFAQRPVPTDTPMIMGAGTQSCGFWTRWSKERGMMSNVLFAWVQGFISRASYSRLTDLLRGRDADGLQAWVDNYCAAHPLDTIELAAGALELELARTAPKVGRPN